MISEYYIKLVVSNEKFENEKCSQKSGRLNSNLPLGKTDAPAGRSYPIFVTLSLRVECSLTGSHSILALERV